MEISVGQLMFFLGLLVPLVMLCCMRWMCKSREDVAARQNQPQNNEPVVRSSPYQEVETLHRSMSYLDPPNGEPPPSYEFVLQNSQAPTVTYVDDSGNIKQVKWDGNGSIPTRTVLGEYNPTFLQEENVGSSSQQTEIQMEPRDS